MKQYSNILPLTFFNYLKKLNFFFFFLFNTPRTALTKQFLVKKKKKKLNLFFFYLILISNISTKYKFFEFSKVSLYLQFFFIHTQNTINFIQSIFYLWQIFFLFLTNLFYYNIKSLYFGTPNLYNESLVLNWYFIYPNFTLWKLSFFFFIFRSMRFNFKTQWLFLKLQHHGFNTVFVSDSVWHYYAIFYFRKNNFFSIGPTTLFTKPWLLSYPLISLSSNFLLQVIFFRLILLSLH